MDKQVNFAVGCGTIANQHINAIHTTPGAELTAVYSRSLDKAEEWGRKRRNRCKNYSGSGRVSYSAAGRCFGPGFA